MTNELLDHSGVEEDEAIIRRLVMAVQDAWTAGDAEAFGEPFAPDCDYTVWNGLYIKGREAIIEGHRFLFAGPMRGTVMRFEIQQIRFPVKDVAIVHAVAGTVESDGRPWPSVRPLFVFARQDGAWQVVAFQNTPIMPREGGTSDD
jgi:uncharacterized protein (TIGR02246 family)